MKTYWRIAVFFIAVVAVLLGLLLFRQAVKPESAIIAGERNKFAASQEKQRMETDPAYASEFQSTLRFLDYRLAVAYNKEKKPDDAIAVLEKLVSGEEAKDKSGALRSSRSYLDEVQYYETLEESYLLKNDQKGAENARQRRTALMAKAEAAKKRENREEGTSATGPRE